MCAGLQFSLARLGDKHSAFTTLLCIFGPIGLLPTSAIRSSQDLLTGQGFGILSNIIYGVCIILGQFLHPAEKYWNYVRSWLIPPQIMWFLKQLRRASADLSMQSSISLGQLYRSIEERWNCAVPAACLGPTQHAGNGTRGG